jgi:murein DD-endopeptidase MepM/ murein hydrolase activator NlpD
MLALVFAVVVVLIRPDAPPPFAVVSALPTTPVAVATATPPAATAPAATVGPLAEQPSPTVLPTLTPPPTPNPHTAQSDPFFDARRFSYAHNVYVPELQTFLEAQPGILKGVTFQVGNHSHTFAEVLVNLSNLYSFNPQIMLALLEQQSGLLSTEQPSAQQIERAMGFEGAGGSRSGLYAQTRWAALELRYALRDYALHAASGTLPELAFADDSRQAVDPDIGLARYALARVLAQTTTPDQLDARLNQFQAVYTSLFGDPRQPPHDWPPLAPEPFLSRPMAAPHRVTSFFDHDTPLLNENGSLVSFWGTIETTLSYDGHTGWDYAMRPPDPVLAAAPGVVVFAGSSDDGCPTPAGAVIIDHGNGYRTLYWHLNAVNVERGQQVERAEQIGIAGETGCAIGPHLHFQVQYLGRDVDPYGWCGVTDDPWEQNAAGQPSIWLWQDMPSPCDVPPPDMVVVDNLSPGFVSSGDWQESPLGYGGNALFHATSRFAREAPPWHVRPLTDTPAVAIWQPELSHSGSYRVIAYVPYVLNGLDDARQLGYRVHHSDGETEVIVNSEAVANHWADLGTYRFDPGDEPSVLVSTLAGDGGRGLWVDAVAWEPVPEDAAAAAAGEN